MSTDGHPKAATTPAKPPAADPVAAMGYTDIIKHYLDQWGLSTLAPIVDQLGQTGASADEIQIRLEQTPEYKKRFAGNDARVKAGLAPLDPATYMALEGQYKQILGQLPKGFYDDKSSIDGFIGGDVSPSELADRVQMANQAWVLAPQSQRDAWNSYYGHAGAGGAVAAILDTTVAEPLIQQQVQAAAIGGSALQQGLALTSQSTAMKAAQQGVTIDQARKAYGDIASRLGADTSIASRFGTSFDQGAEEQATLLGDAATQNKQRNLYASEKAQFTQTGSAAPGANTGGSNY